MRRLIKTDGTERDFEGPQDIARILQFIGAETSDVVRMPMLGDPLHVMVVDDNGYETRAVDRGNNVTELVPVRALRPVNAHATRLYWRQYPGAVGHEIVGDVFICPDDDFA